MLVYKILTATEWQALLGDGATAGALVDRDDGFVHLSTGGQVAETAAKHFTGRDGLMLLALDTTQLGSALFWAPSRGGQLFPHLYALLRLVDVVWARPLPLGPGGRHQFPEGVA